MRRTLLALGGVVLILATACGSPTRANTPTNSGTAATTTTTTVPRPATTTTTVPDTAVIPAHITVTYVDAVLAQLNHVYGDAVRSSVKARKVTPQTLSDLTAIYTSRLRAEEVSIFQEGATAELDKFRAIPGDRRTSVQKLN